MAISIHIQNASGNLTPYKKIIQNSIQATINRINKVVKIDNIEIVVKESKNPELLEKIGGIGPCQAYMGSKRFFRKLQNDYSPFTSKIF